jgi:hypothetical protein
MWLKTSRFGRYLFVMLWLWSYVCSFSGDVDAVFFPNQKSILVGSAVRRLHAASPYKVDFSGCMHPHRDAVALIN